jgi:tRNA A-37 threonylcarbamoyl transferase component Bud32
MVLQDKWTVESLLGVGGMAAVYAAKHRNGKRVAVKMLHAEFTHEGEVKQRFLQEGYAANTIQHEGAVSVMDDDVAPDGSAFIVMELLEGETVEQRWERKGQRLAPAEVLAIVEQLLDVLAAAHGKNVVHRDVKPENLFITKQGQLKVLDFGIARVFEAQRGRATATKVGVVMGTPAFMAPEQARARWDEVDGRTDLWAVGATMFTLLAGRHVHEGVSGNEQLILSATTPAPSLGQVDASISPLVVSIVDRALAFDRAHRWDDAASMREAVSSALAALGGAEGMAVSQQRPATSTMLSGGGSRPGIATTGSASTVIDASGTPSALAAWTKEREMRVAETAKLRAGIAELQQRYAAAKKGVGEAQERVEAGRRERASLQQWFGRQVGTRTAAVEEARRLVRGKMMGVARHAIADRTTFGAELDGSREQIVKLDRAAEFAQRDLRVHEAAIDAYDRRSLGRGVLLLGVAAALLVALIVIPVVWRATRVVDAPPPVPVQQLPPAHS